MPGGPRLCRRTSVNQKASTSCQYIGEHHVHELPHVPGDGAKESLVNNLNVHQESEEIPVAISPKKSHTDIH